MNKDEKIKYGMREFSCDIDVIRALTLCGAFQMFTTYEQNLKELCFNMFSYI